MYHEDTILSWFFFENGGIMKKGLLLIPWILLSTTSAFAHFGMVIPSDTMVMHGENTTVNMKLSFSHPMEMV